MSIFLSYCHEDGEVASKLHHDLANRGLRCWLDKEELLPGQRWRETIELAIRQSSHFIALLSSHSVTKEGFVQRELKLALDFLTEMPPERIFLIPVRVDDCTPAHSALRDLHWVDLFPDYGFALERIVRAVGDSDQRRSGPGILDASACRESSMTLPPLTPDRPRRLYLQFPLEELYSEISTANEHVRLLYTWIYAAKPLLNALTPVSQRGVKIQILMLHPQSAFASLRSREIGFGDPEHGASQVTSNLSAFASWLRQDNDAAGHVEIRLYDAFPTIVMVDTGDRLIYSPLFHGALALEGPYIEARREDEELYLRVQRHFLRLWDGAQVFSTTNEL